MKKRFCLFALALALSLLALNHVMLREDSEKKYGAFYGEKQPIDVFFLGSQAEWETGQRSDPNLYHAQ